MHWAKEAGANRACTNSIERPPCGPRLKVFPEISPVLLCRLWEFRAEVFTDFLNSVQTRCIVKARLRKVHFSGDFLGALIFSRLPVL